MSKVVFKRQLSFSGKGEGLLQLTPFMLINVGNNLNKNSVSECGNYLRVVPKHVKA